MAPPDVQDGNEQGDPSAGEDVQNNLVGVETSHRRRRCCVLIVAVVLCLFIIGGGASVPFVLNMVNKPGSNNQQPTTSGPTMDPSVTPTGFNRSTQARTTSEPTVNTSETPTGFNGSTEPHTEPTVDSSVTPTGFKRSTELRTTEPTVNPSVTSTGFTRSTELATTKPYVHAFDPSVTSTDCAEIQSSVTESTNGTYLIDPDGKGPFYVYCDMTTDGGGWIVFQRRQDGSEDFNRTWDEYKTGFGNLSGEFWLGNEYIHRLTNNRNKTLRIDMVNAASSYYRNIYEKFNISSESEGYTFYVEDHMNEKTENFSTVDRDNDGSWRNIAAEIGGGWWYRYDLNHRSPNGLYGTSSFGWYGSYHHGRMTYCDMKVK